MSGHESDFIYACRSGSSTEVARLLAADPSEIDRRGHQAWTALHFAANAGHSLVASQLLAAKPDLIDAVDNESRAAVHYATMSGHDQVAEMLLALKPEHVNSVDRYGSTLLHLALRRLCSLRILPQLVSAFALHSVNLFGETPIMVAMVSKHDSAFDFLQPQLTVDEILEAIRQCQKTKIYEVRMRAVVDLQCASLLLVLGRDVLGTVFEYLGFWTKDSCLCVF